MAAVKPSIPLTESVYGLMSQLLDLPIRSEADVLRMVTTGAPIRSYQLAFNKFRVPQAALGAASTVRRRLAQGGRLNASESERLFRIARVCSEAEKLFGSSEDAAEWLNAPADFLNDGHPVTPMQLAETDAGARLIEAQLRRTAYGIF